MYWPIRIGMMDRFEELINTCESDCDSCPVQQYCKELWDWAVGNRDWEEDTWVYRAFEKQFLNLQVRKRRLNEGTMEMG